LCEKLEPLPTEKATKAFSELRMVMKALQAVRTNIAHGVLMGEEDFLFRAKERVFTKEQIFKTKELINYGANSGAYVAARTRRTRS
jgi:hypothetical protein